MNIKTKKKKAKQVYQKWKKLMFLYGFSLPIFLISFLSFWHELVLLLFMVLGVFYLVSMAKHCPYRWTYHSLGHLVVFNSVSFLGMCTGGAIYGSSGAHGQFLEVGIIALFFVLVFFIPGMLTIGALVNFIAKIMVEKEKAEQIYNDWKQSKS
ncbi:hypothetical protein [Candidatus Uabimicrobium sp. HlEnr_7]|uniref:hypothetical protein n=1 Tax=Candidatus Uabimicrobium helgolandensis TaxID=3095367 RepID=UPI003555F84E